MAATVVSACVRLASAALLGFGVACNGIVGVEEGQLDPGTLSATLCSNSCEYANNGQCDDGGPRAREDACPIGSDCADCGQRTLPAPDTDVGLTCFSDADCSGTPQGYCAPVGFCTRVCTVHQDCGCPAGTTNGDLSAGRCSAACIGLGDDGEHYCLRVCGADAHCDAPSACTFLPSYGVCLPPE